jgi:hypothetical protein
MTAGRIPQTETLICPAERSELCRSPVCPSGMMEDSFVQKLS